MSENITLKLKVTDEYRRLRRSAGYKDDKEFLTDALALLRWAIQTTRDGRSVGYLRENGNRGTVFVELSMPILDKLKKGSTDDKADTLDVRKLII